MTPKTAQRLASGAVRIARGLVRRLPAPIRTRLDDRMFYAIFQLTRVTNDNYRWRPGDDEANGPAPS